jgi:hypothetical protein
VAGQVLAAQIGNLFFYFFIWEHSVNSRRIETGLGYNKQALERWHYSATRKVATSEKQRRFSLDVQIQHAMMDD